ncbi:MAG: hypothetical protein EP349_02730 [Alphaproteobacteria bacterium]|nr:MAG: hypothetical protein EP349_02730 [Alphaproteobacteria bacterium]
MTEHPEKDEREDVTAQDTAAESSAAPKRRPWYKTLFSRKANIFVKAARSLVLAFAGLWAAEASLPYVLDGRPLHDNEIKMLQKMGYDDSIDYSKVKVHSSDFGDWCLSRYQMCMATKGSMIIVPQDVYSEDFSSGNDIDEFFFSHEVGHVWQNQNNVLFARLHAMKDLFNYVVGHNDGVSHYEYRLEEGKDLTDYGLEQQPTIIADFDRLTRRGEPPFFAGLDPNADMDAEALKAQYQSVLKNFLDNPDYARNRAYQPWR